MASPPETVISDGPAAAAAELTMLGIALLCSLVLLLSPLGPIGRSDATALDAALVSSSLAHALLVLILTLAHWLAGAGVVTALSPRSKLSLSATLLIGFPVGLLVAAILVTMLLAAPSTWPLAVGLWMVCMSFLWPRAVPAEDPSRIFRVFLRLSAIAVIYGAWVGLFKHGPTPFIEARPPGDFVFYASAVRSLNAHVFPTWDLTIEGERLNGFNMLVPAMGAAVLHWLPIDPFLFLGAGGSAAFLISAAGALHLYLRDVENALGEQRLRLTNSVTIALAVLTSSYGPTWNPDSIPMVHMVATTISGWYLIRRAEAVPKRAPFATAMAILGPLLSKVATGIVLIPLAALTALPLLRSASKRTAQLAAAGAAIVAAYVLFMLWSFGAWALGVHGIGPFTWQYYYCCHVLLMAGALRDLSTCLLITVALFALRSLTGLILASSMLVGLFYSILFFPAVLAAAIIVAITLAERKSLAFVWRLVALVALLCAVDKSVLEDFGGPIASLTWILGFGLAVCLAIQEATKVSSGGAGNLLLARIFSPTTFVAPILLIGSCGLAAAAMGKIRLDTGIYRPADDYPGLTPDLYDIWRAVRKLTPAGALIFTDSVNDVNNLTGGWNTYAAQGGRQLFISQWVQSRSPNPHAGFIKEKLDQNEAVFAGRLRPTGVVTTRSFATFYAVANILRSMPPNWHLVYRNAEWVLYIWQYSGG